jgi:hypothetical protein
VGSFGDLSIFALYKSFGLPDGAALHTGDVRLPRRRGGFGLTTLGVRHAHWLMGRSGALGDLGARLRPELDLVGQDFDSAAFFAPWAIPTASRRGPACFFSPASSILQQSSADAPITSSCWLSSRTWCRLRSPGFPAAPARGCSPWRPRTSKSFSRISRGNAFVH